MAALATEEIQELERQLAEFAHNPGIYEVIRGEVGGSVSRPEPPPSAARDGGP